MQIFLFFLIDDSSESTGESVHWQKLDRAFVALKCDKYQFFQIFLSRLTITTDFLLGLIWVQTVCKCQQLTKVA